MHIDAYTLAGLLVGATSIGFVVGVGVVVGVSVRFLGYQARKRAATGK